jgi:hypothetical protein
MSDELKATLDAIEQQADSPDQVRRLVQEARGQVDRVQRDADDRAEQRAQTQARQAARTGADAFTPVDR